MKHVKMFESFVNEDEVKTKLKYSKNYVQQDQNWLKDITQAQSEDKWRNNKKQSLGSTIDAHSNGLVEPEKTDAIKAQRELINNIDPDTDWSTKSDAEIKRELNDIKKRIYESSGYLSVTKNNNS